MANIIIEELFKFQFETAVYEQSLNPVIAGTDEVGRGCIAGPIVGSAVVWDIQFIKKSIKKLEDFITENNSLKGSNTGADRKNLIKILAKKLKEDDSYTDVYMLLQIDDSKKLSPAKREKLSEFIKKKAAGWGIHEISADEIDKYGISRANKLVLENSCLNIPSGQTPTHVLVDHFNIFQNHPKISPIPVTKGDEKSLSIGAASIIAKVYRDDLMKKHHEQYPNYGFDSNAGYGTPINIAGIKSHGLCPLHRKSFTRNFQ